MTAMISVVSGGAVVESWQFGRTGDGAVMRIAALDGADYVLSQLQDEFSAGLAVRRVGGRLVFEQDAGGSARSVLIIDGFFGSEARLFGIGADGGHLPYLAATELGGIDTAAVSDGVRAPLMLMVTKSAAFIGGREPDEGITAMPADAATKAATAESDLAQAHGSGTSVVGQSVAVAGAVMMADTLDDAALAAPTSAVDDTAVTSGTGIAGAIAADAEAEGGVASAVNQGAVVNDAFDAGYVPVIDAMLDDHGPIQGVIENGGCTDDGRPQIIGKADPGVRVHVYRGVDIIGRAIADANGDWSFAPSVPLADGRHSISIIHEYPNGDTSEESEPFVITVDKVIPDPPLITGVLDDEGRITGEITDQSITDDNKPMITGSAEAGAQLIVYDKDRVIGSTTVDADGKWSFIPEPPLADGLHLLSYAAVDRAGNASERSAVFEFVVDARPEKINIYVAQDNEGSIQGDLFTGSITDDSTPTLTGSATAGGIVSIYEGDVLLGQVVADVDGTWQFPVAAVLSEGAHTFHATVTLAAKGESGRSSLFDLIVDLTPPQTPSIEQVLDDAGVVQGLVERGQSTDDATPTLSGKAEKGSTVHIHSNGSLLGSVLADAAGNWVFTPVTPLSDGSHVFTVIAVDAAGHPSGTSEPFAIVIDTIPATTPTIAVVYDDVGSWTGNLAPGDESDDYRPDVSGTADAGSTVIIKDHGIEIGRVTADSAGDWRFTPQSNLAEGPHRLTAEAVTADGKLSLSSDHFDFNVVQNGDDHPPAIGTGAVAFNTTLMIDTSGSMTGTPLSSVKTALTRLAAEYLAKSGGEAVTLTIVTMTSFVPVRHSFSSMEDPNYTKFIAAVNALSPNGGADYEGAINATMNSIKADYLRNDGPDQVFILGDAQNSLSQVAAIRWQAMLLNPTGNAPLSVPIQSTPISFAPFVPAYEHSFHLIATGGKATDMPTPEMMPDLLLGAAIGTSVSGNLLDNDVKLALDGDEYLTQISFEGGTFRIAANNSLVMSNVGSDVSGSYDPAIGLLTITTGSGWLRVYMHASDGHRTGDYAYSSKAVQLYYGESTREEVFSYLAVDASGVSQAADLHVVLHPSDARNLLQISTLGKGTGTQGDFVTADGSAGREVSGTLSQLLAQGLKVQVSVDGGQSWQDAVTHGRNWSFVDLAAHSSSWTVQVRVSDGVTHGTEVVSQDMTLVVGSAAPTITSIPDAVGVYTAALAQNGSEVTVLLTGTGAKAGDTVHIQWGSSTYDQLLTALNIANGSLTLNVPAAVTYATTSYIYDFAVTAKIIGQDGALGAVSTPYNVVGAYTRSLLTDSLQLSPVDNVYAGNGLSITTTGTMAKTGTTANSVSGLTFNDSVQANATFTLHKPADNISLRLSGADNALGALIRVYDVNGSLMHEQTVFGGNTAQHLATFTWTKSGPVDIGSFTVEAASSQVTLDLFSQYVVTHTADRRDPNLIDLLTETFYGSDGNDVVSLSQGSAAYFKQATAAIHGGAGIDTLQLVGSSHVLNLTTAGSRISSMEIIDITGSGNNSLTLGLSDVLRNGATDLFHIGDKSRVQMMVNGNAGDRVNLSDLLSGDVDHGDWVQKSAVIIGGATYNAYQHSALDVELLIAGGITVSVTNSAAVRATFERAGSLDITTANEVMVAAEADLFVASTSVADDAGKLVLSDANYHGQHLPADRLELHDVRLEAY